MMIDWTRVAELREEIGEEDFGEVVELFLSEVSDVAEQLRSGAMSASMEETLHLLKGSALNLGLVELGRACQQGENLASGGRADEVDLARVLSVYDLSIAEFASRLSGHRAA